MKIYIQLILLLHFTLLSFSQNPVPAGAATKRTLLIGATAHTGDGNTVIENAAVGFANGKITLVADATRIKIDRTAYDTIINLDGKHIYPGLIAMDTQLGIREIELVRATNDNTESGDINPSSRALIAYNTDSRVTPTVRSNGIMLAQVVPQGGMISGTSSVVELDAWNWEDAAYKTDEGVHLNFPSMRIFKFPGADPEDKQKERMEKNLAKLKDFFNDARSYCHDKNRKERNLHLEAVCGLGNGNQKLYVHCNYAKEIIAAVNLCRDYGFKMVLVGGHDAWMLTDMLRENNIPVIIERTHRLPAREDENINSGYLLPSQLKNAGVEFCIADEGFWQQRNLAFQAGSSAAYGLTKEEALKAISLSPAKILGIEKSAGSIEEGKDATLVISSGDLLDMKSQTVEMAFIRGKQIDLDNIHSQLYHKYMNKYGLK